VPHRATRQSSLKPKPFLPPSADDNQSAASPDGPRPPRHDATTARAIGRRRMPDS
jgi:hypothetical protein